MRRSGLFARWFAVGFVFTGGMAWAEPSQAHGIPWCGIWMSKHVYHKSVRRLWVAREWAHVGHRARGPGPGVIGVQRHHVFQVVRVVGPGRVLAISGNDGGRVRTRVRSTGNVIAWRAL